VSQEKDENLTRRKFLARAGKAGLSIAAAAAVSLSLYDDKGPGAFVKTEGQVKLSDFSIPYIDGQTISIIRGADRKKTVNKAIELLGGIGRFVKKDDIVVIKPNVAFASPPMLGATAGLNWLARWFGCATKPAQRRSMLPTTQSTTRQVVLR